MGKKDRLKRSPSSASSSKIKLSLKELQHFVTATNIAATNVDCDVEELELTNQGDLRRSLRCRGPPKDPYANEFVGDIWTQIHCSKVHSLDQSKATAATKAYKLKDVDDLDLNQATSCELAKGQEVFIDSDGGSIGGGTKLVALDDSSSDPLKLSTISANNHELQSKISRLKGRMEATPSGYESQTPQALTHSSVVTHEPCKFERFLLDDLQSDSSVKVHKSESDLKYECSNSLIISDDQSSDTICDNTAGTRVDVHPRLVVDEDGTCFNPTVDTISSPKEFVACETHVPIHTHTRSYASACNGRMEHVPNFEKPDLLGKEGLFQMGSLNATIHGCDTCQSCLSTTVLPLRHHLNQDFVGPEHIVNTIDSKNHMPATTQRKSLAYDGLLATNTSCSNQISGTPCDINSAFIATVSNQHVESSDNTETSKLLHMGSILLSNQEVTSSDNQNVGPVGLCGAPTFLANTQGVALTAREATPPPFSSSVANASCPAFEMPSVNSVQVTEEMHSSKIEQVDKPQWADLLKTKPISHEFNLSHVDVSSCRLNRRLTVPPAIIETGCNEWNNTLVGFFLDRRLPYSLVHKMTTKLWENVGLIDILVTDQ